MNIPSSSPKGPNGNDQIFPHNRLINDPNAIRKQSEPKLVVIKPDAIDRREWPKVLDGGNVLLDLSTETYYRILSVFKNGKLNDLFKDPKKYRTVSAIEIEVVGRAQALFLLVPEEKLE